MTRLLFAGQPRFVRSFGAQFHRYAPETQTFLAPSPLWFLLDVIRVRPDATFVFGFRPGAPTVRGRAFDAVTSLVRLLRPSMTIVRCWIGTDVLDATRDWKAGRLRRGYATSRQRDVHIAGAPWLVDELAAIGMEATFIAFPGADLPAQPEAPPVPEVFRVVSYMAAGRFDFYGGPTLIEVARRLPEIPFDVVGCLAPPGLEIPPNLTFLGWRSDVESLILASAVVVHLTRHDSLSGIVREALANGRHVVWNHSLPSVVLIPIDNPTALADAVRDLAARHAAGSLRPNERGWHYVRDELRPSDAVRRLIAAVNP